MARDYKNSGRSTAKRPARSAPAWRPLLTGLALGLTVALGVHLYHSGKPAQGVVPSDTPTPAIAKSEPAPATAPAEDPRPRFEFYKLLPEMEVPVPEEEARRLRNQPETRSPAVTAPPPAQQQATTRPPAPGGSAGSTPSPAPGTRYLLQAGSFQSFSDADRLKAQLALMGVEANIQSVELRAGETWHRVRIGPFEDGGEASRVRQRLETSGVETILLRLGS